MRARPLLLVALLSAAGPAVAGTRGGADDDGILFALRGGYGVPFGDVARGEPLSDLVKAKLPLWLEVGYRFTAYFRSALYFELAPMSLVDCPTGAACSAFDVRSGVLLQLHPAPRSWLDPWVGIGFGVEHLQATAPPPDRSDPNSAWELAWDGLELPVEAGLDFAVGDFLTLGPYANASFAQFTSASARPPGKPSESGAVHDRGTHGWLQAGLKLTLKL